MNQRLILTSGFIFAGETRSYQVEIPKGFVQGLGDMEILPGQEIEMAVTAKRGEMTAMFAVAEGADLQLKANQGETIDLFDQEPLDWKNRYFKCPFQKDVVWLSVINHSEKPARFTVLVVTSPVAKAKEVEVKPAKATEDSAA